MNAFLTLLVFFGGAVLAMVSLAYLGSRVNKIFDKNNKKDED